MASTKGTLLILNSALFFGSYGVWSRLMGNAFGEFTQAWTRGLILLLFVLAAGFAKKLFKPIPKKDFVWFLLIALAGGLNQAPYYFGFQHLEIGTATMLFYAALVVGGYLIGKLFFNETLTKTKLISLIISIVGVATVYKLSLSPGQILPASLTVLAGLMGAIGAILPKKLSNNYHEFQIMSGYFIIMVVANSVLAQVFNESLPPFSATIPWIAQLFYSTALLIANFSVIEGFKHLEASIGSLIGLAEILFGVLFGFLFFHEIIGVSTLIGGLLIIFAAALPNLQHFPPSPAEAHGLNQKN